MKTSYKLLIFLCFIGLQSISFIGLSQTGTKSKIILPEPVYEEMKGSGKLKDNVDYIIVPSSNTISTNTNTLSLPSQERAPINTPPPSTTGGSCNCYVPLDGTFSTAEFTIGTAPDYRNDDGSTPVKTIAFNFCMYGTNYNQFYINNNGNISFGTAAGTYTSTGFPNNTNVMIAPFWADVDTRNTTSGLVYYKITPTYAIVKWEHVGYFSSQADKLNTFQLIISDGVDPIIPNGNNIAFCYGSMNWTTGSASGGVNGFGGIPATAGINKGDGTNYAQIGRFSVTGAAYYGPSNTPPNPNGVNWLSNQSFYFSSCGSNNVPPIPVGINNCDTLRVCGNNDSLVIHPVFLSPEPGQTTTVTVTTTSSNITVLGTTAGNVGTATVLIVASAANAGNNVITFTATDNGTPAQTTVVTENVYIDTTGLVNFTPQVNGVLQLCAGAPTTLSVTPSNLDSYLWSTGDVTSSITATTPGQYYVTSTLNGCSKSNVVNITATPAATFSYVNSPYCQNQTNPSPTYTGAGAAGTFTFTPAGLSINPATGLVDLLASTPGTYTVTNSIAATAYCPAVSASSTITIAAVPVATFSYVGSPFCQSSPNPSPTYSGGGFAGTFSYTGPGTLALNPNDGTINLATSGLGTYTVTNTIPGAGGCPASVATATITISAPPVATFYYNGNPFCKNGTNPSPTYTNGGTAGVFTSTPSGLFIVASSGVVSLTLSAPGTYTVTNFIAAANGCPSATGTATITVTAVPIATFSYPNSPYCQGGTNPLPTFGTGATAGFFTSNPSGLFITGNSGLVNLTTSTPATYNVINTIAAAGGCPSATATSTITIVAGPTASFSYVDDPYCQGGANPSPTPINGGTSGIYSSSLLNGSGTLVVNASTGVVDLSASTPGSWTVVNTVPPANGCPTALDSTIIDINPIPDGSFIYTLSPYCQDAADQLPDFIGNGQPNFFFTNPNVTTLLLDANSGQVSISASSPGDYWVYNLFPAGGGCPDVLDSAEIIITPLLNATFSYTGSPYCQNASNPSPTFVTGASAGTFTYHQTGSAAVSGLSINSSTGVVDLTTSTAGSYEVINSLISSGTCPASTDSTTIVINPSAVATFSYTGSPYCQGAANPSPTFSNGGVAGTFTYTGTAGNTLVINPSTGLVTLASSSPGTYTVTNTISPAGCPNVIATATITIATSFAANFSYPGSPYCQNATNPSPVYSGGGVAGNFTYTGAAGTTLSINPSTGLVNLGLSTAGTYTVTNSIAAANGCAAVSATATITITQAPIANFSYVGSPFCTGGTNPLPVFSAGGFAGTFSASSGACQINPVTGEITLISSTPNTYTITNFIAATGGCPASIATTTVVINAGPVATFSYTGSPYCQNGINPSPTYNGGTPGTFTASPSGGLLNINSSNGLITLLSSQPGTYTVTNTVPASAGCAPAVATSTVVVNALQTATFSYSSQNYCQTGTQLATFTGTPGGTYTSTGTGTLALNANNGTIDCANSTVGTYTVTYTSPGPCAASSVQTVNILAAPTANAGPDQTIPCSVGFVTLNGSGVGATSYSWTASNGGNILSGANTAAPVVNHTGTYLLTVSNGSCSATSSVNVTGTPAPVASFGANPTQGSPPLTVNFISTSTNATGYAWTLGDGNSSSVQNPTEIYTASGTYLVTLVVSNGTTCFDTARTTIFVYDSYSMVVPNVFSPNGDGVNDLFKVDTKGVASLDGAIYDRWGLKMYSWHSVNEGWDGHTASGKLSAEGTYYYVLTAKGFDGTEHSETGYLMLVK